MEVELINSNEYGDWYVITTTTHKYRITIYKIGSDIIISQNNWHIWMEKEVIQELAIMIEKANEMAEKE